MAQSDVVPPYILITVHGSLNKVILVMGDNVWILMNVKVRLVAMVVYVIILMVPFNVIVNLVFRICFQIKIDNTSLCSSNRNSLKIKLRTIPISLFGKRVVEKVSWQKQETVKGRPSVIFL